MRERIGLVVRPVDGKRGLVFKGFLKQEFGGRAGSEGPFLNDPTWTNGGPLHTISIL